MYKNILVKKTVYSSAILIKGFKDHAFWLHFFFLYLVSFLYKLHANSFYKAFILTN